MKVVKHWDKSLGEDLELLRSWLGKALVASLDSEVSLTLSIKWD